MASKQDGVVATTKAIEMQPKADPWIDEEERSILRVEVPGFRKEDLKVQVDTLGNLAIVGEGRADGVNHAKFWQKFRVPDYCTRDGIKATLNNGVLCVITPRKEPITKKAAVPEPSTDHRAQAGPIPKPRPESSPESEKETGSIDARNSGDELDTKKWWETEPDFAGRLRLTMTTREKRIVSVYVCVVVVTIGLGLLTYCPGGWNSCG